MFRPFMENGIAIRFARADEKLPEDYAAEVMENLCVSEREKINRYVFERDRNLCITGKWLLLQLLREYTGDPAFSLCGMRLDAHRRPYIAGMPDFNVSHSGEWVVAALSTRGRVGVDVEVIRQVEPKDFTRFFTETEMNRICGCGNTSCETLFRMWTQKEAVMKADGRGMFLPSREIQIFPNGTARADGRDYHLTEFSQVPGCVCYVAVEVK